MPDKSLRLLRSVALFVVVGGALGSLAFMLRAGRNTPRLLLVLFVIWILSPYALLAWANRASISWSTLTQGALYGMTLVITLISLAYYGGVLQPPAGSAAAFEFVAIPGASWAALAIVVPIAAWIARRRSRRASDG